ncbi:MAG: hypothetical protein KDD00_03525 [Ignavibacteriae bacterium]|nr:hypothetical protein [Ignavibacteriota bacterium]
MNIQQKKKIKFLTLYNSFTEKEKTEFRKFLGNEVNNNGRNYNKILSSIEQNEAGKLKLKGSGSDVTRWNRFSELHKLADEFLILKSIESDDLIHKFLLFKEYDKRDLQLTFEQKYKNLKDGILNNTLFKYDYNTLFQIDNIYLKHLVLISDSEKFLETLYKSSVTRNGFFIIEILEKLIEMITVRESKPLIPETMDEKIYGSLDIQNVIKYFKESSELPDKIFHTIRFLHYTYLSYSDLQNSSHYLKARKIFFRELKDISDDKREKYFICLMNLKILKVNKAIPGANEELFFLMDKKLKEGLLNDFRSKNLPVNQFRDFVLTGLNLKKHKWVENFINNYSDCLPEEIRNDYVSLARARLYFSLKNYQSSFDHLNKVSKKNHLLYSDVTLLKLKILFELKKIDESFNEAKNFREYLRKERDSEHLLLQNSKEFCKAFTLLLKLYQSPTRKNYNDLQYLLSKKSIISKKWIILKMNEIKLV